MSPHLRFESKFVFACAGELLALGPVELAEACDTTPEAARGLLRAVAQQVAPPFATAAALLAERRAAQGWLPTPLPVRAHRFPVLLCILISLTIFIML